MSAEPGLEVSVVIPNWNGEAVLPRCLDSVIADLEGSGLRHEIIIVDDASTDGGAGRVRQRYRSVTVLINAWNSGFAFSCNRGLRRARGAFLLLLNNDVVVPRGTIGRVRDFMVAHPEAGGAGCRIVDERGQLDRSCRDFPTLSNLLGNRILRLLARRLPRIAADSVEHWPHDSVRAVDWLHLVFFMVSRRAYSIVGGLDERFFMYGEDADYGRRLNRAGFAVMFVPDVSVIHVGSYSGNKRWGPMALVRRQSALYELLRKWGSPSHAWAYRGLASVPLVGHLVWSHVLRRAGRPAPSDADLAVTALLLRSHLGLLRDDDA